MNLATRADTETAEGRLRLASSRPTMGANESLYRWLLAKNVPDEAARSAGAQALEHWLEECAALPEQLPERPEALYAWMEDATRATLDRYAAYMRERAAGAPRRYFSCRAHALYFLRMVAPTKLVDGAWLSGLVAHADNPRLDALLRTYIEELGEGDPSKNHVLLYRQLLRGLGMEQERASPDEAWKQGAIQLALGANAQRFLPEVAGFNLGYEQLPLHLLITAYELDELGIDPYYFTLHVTVDNAGSGHARQACDAALELLPRHGDAGEAWARMRAGSKLGCAGLGTEAVIAGFDLREEVLRILSEKAILGAGAHADHCRLAGRSINEWLRAPGGMTAFVDQLEQSGFVRIGEPPQASRFWQLLQGERAQMFGVFTPYELQVLHDWIRADASADGMPYTEVASNQARRRPRFRAAARHRETLEASPFIDAMDPDLDAFRQCYARADSQERRKLLVEALSPRNHWTPAGLYATRLVHAGR